MGRATERYQPRHAEASVLHGVVREHLDDFLRAAADRADGAGLPEFITREFHEFLTCGVLAHGFARVRCEQCASNTWSRSPAKAGGSVRAAGAAE